MPQRHSLVPQAVVFELLLGLLGAVLALGLDEPLRDRLAVTPAATLRGLAACAPMLAGLVALSRSRWRPLVELRRQVERLVDSLFSGVSAAALAAVSASAGLGEEILFRGALQPIAAGWTTPLFGWLLVSVLFGALHAASATYFVLATAVGLYFGWLAQHFNDLVAPILAHALYDFAALLYLRNSSPHDSAPPGDEPTSVE